MQNRYGQIVNKVNVPSGDSKEAAMEYVGISEEKLQEIAGGLFLYLQR